MTHASGAFENAARSATPPVVLNTTDECPPHMNSCQFYSHGLSVLPAILTYLFGATTALRSWPASGVSETAHGFAPSSASPLSRPMLNIAQYISINVNSYWNDFAQLIAA